MAGRARRGRPPVGAESTKVDTRVSGDVADALCQEAAARDVPLALVMREALEDRAQRILTAKNRQTTTSAPS